MEMRERRPENSIRPAGNANSSDPGGENLDNMRSAAHEFLAAGDAAVNKALSHGSSESYLKSNRQTGGQ